jgi:hypothetical protein
MKGSLILFACVVGSCFGQQLQADKAFLGVWNLDLSKSKFPPGMTPKGSQIYANQNGYVVVNQDPPPGFAPPAVGVAFVGGQCYLIGGQMGLACTANLDNPRRPSLNIKMGDAIVVKVETELQGDTTMTVKQTNLTAPSGPVVSELVYTKVPQAPAATKK